MSPYRDWGQRERCGSNGSRTRRNRELIPWLGPMEKRTSILRIKNFKPIQLLVFTVTLSKTKIVIIQKMYNLGYDRSLIYHQPRQDLIPSSYSVNGFIQIYGALYEDARRMAAVKITKTFRNEKLLL